MRSIVLFAYGLPLLVLHALCAVALGGASVHQASVAILALRGRFRPRLARTYGTVSLWLYGATLLWGALLYPRYRIHVRAAYLDAHAPWAANLFDLKENLATLGLPLAVGTFLLSRDMAQLRQDREALWLYGVLALLLAALCLFNIVSGLLCTGVRGI
ncbi:MAG: hypothetical protein RMK29_07945 [Myxococcales bacterium]|nr:hypothetical protein [Myxococcota bacterium]MDW8281626.1 hypothetical protein [Myxococcales bacterium]